MTPSGDMPGATAQEQSFSLANMVPQTAELNRGVWEGIESAVRHWALREGELYVVTGPAFVGQQVGSIGPDGVLVPSSTWKAVYDPRTGGAGVYVCHNTAQPTCSTVTVAALAQEVGIDPFPGVSPAAMAVLTSLPAPEPSHYGRTGGQHRRRRRDTLSLVP